MNTVLLVVCLVLLFAFAAAYFTISRKLGEIKEAQKDNTSTLQLGQSINETRRALDTNLATLNSDFGAKLDRARDVFAKLNVEIESMKVIGKNVEDLRSTFMNSKLRGNFGERVLYEMLADKLPKGQYETQYSFKNGGSVDAILRTQAGLVPIDSKFPYDSYKRTLAPDLSKEALEAEKKEFQRAVRGHIKDIAKKYILPEEGTLDFAIMYVPSEAAYYEIISSDEESTVDLARQSRILMVSPNSMHYYLEMLRFAYQRAQVAENAQKILGLLNGVHQEMVKFEEPLGVLAKHVSHTKGAMETVQAGYDRLALKMGQVRELE